MTATKENARRCAAALVSQVNAVLITRAHAELMREKIDAIKAEVLDYLDVRDDDGNRIIEPRWSWRMADSYAGKFYAEMDKRHAEAGYKLEPGFCPALIAEDLQRQAEHLLVKSAEEFFPGVTVNALLCCSNGLERYRQYIDLLMKLVINAPGYKPIRI